MYSTKQIHTSFAGRIMAIVTLVAVLLFSMPISVTQAKPLAAAAITYIGEAGSATRITTGTTLTITTTTAVAAGDDIIITFAMDNITTPTAATVASSPANIFTVVADINYSFGAPNRVREIVFVAYHVAAMPAGSTITITSDSTRAAAATVSVFRGLAASGLDRTVSAQSGGALANASSGATPATTQADELLIGAVGTHGPVGDLAGTWSNSFIDGPRIGTTGGALTNVTTSMGYRIVNATGTYTAAKTGMTAVHNVAAIATFKMDVTAPTVTINQAGSQVDPTGTSPINFTAVFSERVIGFSGTDVTLGGATTAVVTEIAPNDGTTYNVAVSGITVNPGTVVASIGAGMVTDVAGNDNTASTSTDNSVYFDNSAPTVTINQAGSQGDPTNASPIHFTAVFSKSVMGFANNDVTLSGTTGASTIVVSEVAPNDGTTYDVAVSGMTSSGTVTASIVAGAASDGIGNPSQASTSTDNSVTYDNAAPTVTINQAGSQGDPTNASTINFTAVFSEPVNGFAGSGISISGTAGATAVVVAEIAPNDGTTYNVAVSGMSGTGTVIASVDAGAANDDAGNSSAASTSTDNSVTYNNVGPQVSIVRTDPNPTTASSVTFTVTFTTNVTGLSASNFGLSSAGVSGPSITGVSGSGSTYSVAVNVGSGSGTVGLNMSNSTGVADSASNPVGNVPYTGPVYTIDQTAPTVIANGINSTPDTGDGHVDNNEIVNVAITQLHVSFSEDMGNAGGGTGPDDVTNPANYILVRDNGDGIQTSVCSAGVTGSDIQYVINSVTYSNGGGSGPYTATLNINNGVAITNGVYRLLVCGSTSIVDLSGIELAGDGTTSRTDFMRNFIVATNGNGNASTGTTTNTTRTSTTSLPIPATGFAPNLVTKLPAQPAEKAYTAYASLVLEIPSLGVKTEIVGVPQTKEGWDVTWLGKQAGYLEGSAFPTMDGNSVITAHVWDALNKSGIFYNLKTLKYGDKILVHAWGTVYTYQVVESQMLMPRDIMTVIKHKDGAWVTLVTCESFDAKTQGYRYRRMVRAVLVSSAPESK